MRNQIARAADEERERALRQQLAVDDELHDAVREHGRAGGRLAEDGHAREQRYRRFLSESPGGEVEGVDVHRNPMARHRDVLAVEARRATELDAVSVNEETRVSQCVRYLGKGKQGRDRAVDVELRIRARVAAVRDAELVQILVLGR